MYESPTPSRITLLWSEERWQVWTVCLLASLSSSLLRLPRTSRSVRTSVERRKPQQVHLSQFRRLQRPRWRDWTTARRMSGAAIRKVNRVSTIHRLFNNRIRNIFIENQTNTVSGKFLSFYFFYGTIVVYITTVYH